MIEERKEEEEEWKIDQIEEERIGKRKGIEERKERKRGWEDGENRTEDGRV